jgi:hypothetical protein
MGCGFDSLRPSPSSLVASLALLLNLIDRRLGDAAHCVVGFLLRGHAHLDQHREPARLVVVQSVFRRSVHLVLLYLPLGLLILPDRPVNLGLRLTKAAKRRKKQ